MGSPAMNTEKHWENVYREKEPEAVSWYRPHLDTSLALIEKAAPEHYVPIIDVGGGESTLVDDLLAAGYQSITVLDVSQTAIDVTKKRLGFASEGIHWIAADILTCELASSAYDVWHDRAVFRFRARWTKSVLPTFAKWHAAVKPEWACARWHVWT